MCTEMFEQLFSYSNFCVTEFVHESSAASRLQKLIFNQTKLDEWNWISWIHDEASYRILISSQIEILPRVHMWK